MDFLLLPSVAPYLAVLLVLFALGVVEVLSLMTVGAGLSNGLNLVDTDAWPDIPVVNWFVVQGVPFMLILTSFLLGFGATGVLVQLPAGVLPHVLVAPLSVFGGMLSIRLVIRTLKRLRVMPVPAVRLADFIGREAVLLSNRASHIAAGEAVLRDEHGARHSVMVRPVDTSLLLFEGDRVQLTARLDDGFFDAKKL